MSRRTVITALVCACVLLAGLALTRWDRPRADAPATENPAGSTETTNPSPNVSDGYWTDERMRSASPEPMPTEP